MARSTVVRPRPSSAPAQFGLGPLGAVELRVVLRGGHAAARLRSADVDELGGLPGLPGRVNVGPRV